MCFNINSYYTPVINCFVVNMLARNGASLLTIPREYNVNGYYAYL